MHYRTHWARALIAASGFTLALTGALPSSASAHGVKKLHTANSHSAVSSRHSSGSRRATRSATTQAASNSVHALGHTLIFGGGDQAGADLGINPTESLTNLEDMLTGAGYSVEVTAKLPKNLTGYTAVWFVNTGPLTSTEESELELYVKSGHGLFLTGESEGCCGALDHSDSSVIDSVVTSGNIQAGTLGGADDPTAPNSINVSAIDDAAINPNNLTGWTPDGPGGMTGVAADNVLTSTTSDSEPMITGAVWDGSSISGGLGRLAVLMNINWLEAESWDQATATQMAINLERFLTHATPVLAASNSDLAGYAARASGVRDVSSEWSVPTVECGQATGASALGIWVGIDGFGNNRLINTGVGVTCASPTASPCYYLFNEVGPGAQNLMTSGCSGVTPGDNLAVRVSNEPYGSSVFLVTITDTPEGGGPPFTVTDTLTVAKYLDASAECVVQLPDIHVGQTRARYHDLADFGSVSFTQCQATATEKGGDALDVDQLPTGSDDAFTVTDLDMGNRTNSLATTVPPNFPNSSWSVNWDAASL
jgi:hypothetical protein